MGGALLSRPLQRVTWHQRGTLQAGRTLCRGPEGQYLGPDGLGRSYSPLLSGPERPVIRKRMCLTKPYLSPLKFDHMTFSRHKIFFFCLVTQRQWVGRGPLTAAVSEVV